MLDIKTLKIGDDVIVTNVTHTSLKLNDTYIISNITRFNSSGDIFVELKETGNIKYLPYRFEYDLKISRRKKLSKIIDNA